jgi:hypothetical protein
MKAEIAWCLLVMTKHHRYAKTKGQKAARNAAIVTSLQEIIHRTAHTL